jgi:hypothetical protein
MAFHRCQGSLGAWPVTQRRVRPNRVGRDSRPGVGGVVGLCGPQQVERPFRLAAVVGDGALEGPHRGAQHRLVHILGVLPGQHRMAARSRVVAQVEGQASQEVGELAAKQRQVGAVLEALTGIQELLDLLPAVPDLTRCGSGPVPCSARQPRLRDQSSSGKEALMNVYVGMDVHRKRSQVAVVDDAGVPQRNRNVANDPATLIPVLGALPPGTPVAFEAAYGWGWLVELLEELEPEPHLVHPSRCKAIASARLQERQGRCCHPGPAAAGGFAARGLDRPPASP